VTPAVDQSAAHADNTRAWLRGGSILIPRRVGPPLNDWQGVDRLKQLRTRHVGVVPAHVIGRLRVPHDLVFNELVNAVHHQLSRDVARPGHSGDR